MRFRLPHANHYETDAMNFVAAWQVLGRLYGPEGWDWQRDPMPRNNRRQTLAAMLSMGLHFGADVLCRCIAPPSYRSAMHPTNEFLRANATVMEECRAENPVSGREVKGVRLSQAVVDAWVALPEGRRAAMLAEWEQKVDGLLGSVPAPPRRELREAPPSQPRRYRRTTSAKAGTRPDAEWWRPALPPEDLVRFVASCDEETLTDGALHALVEWVHREPFQARWDGGQEVGPPVTGWDQRLHRYFWPKPQHGYASEHEQFSRLGSLGAGLAGAIEDGREWDDDECRGAVEFAEEVFKWGGVPQRGTPATPERVRHVLANALSEHLHYPRAPMNSGWTKVAAFGTAHLEGTASRMPQVIWDSRVSTAIIWRLDQLLSAAGLLEIPEQLRCIGSVSGRGGSRPRALHLKWSNGYQSWQCQFAGSRIVARMRDVLNAGARLGASDTYPQMPLPDDGGQAWTVRGTEMVLFMDGY